MGGRFLYELSMVERAQPREVVSRVEMMGEAARVQSGAGTPVVIPLDTGRIRIAELISDTGESLVTPSTQDPQTYPGAPTAQQVWCELLGDVGSYLQNLSHADPALRLIGMHRDGRTARIEVTNGVRELAYEVPLDSGEMPAAVTVEIAAVFPEASKAR